MCYIRVHLLLDTFYEYYIHKMFQNFIILLFIFLFDQFRIRIFMNYIFRIEIKKIDIK